VNEYAAIEHKLGRRTYFPNTSAAAYFDPQSQTIHIAAFTAPGILDALSRQDLPALRIPLSTMLHEITHWADLVGTLWGREYLKTVYEALRSMPATRVQGREHEFNRFIDLHDRTRRLMMSDYYRVVHASPKAHGPRQPWRISLSAGREFDPFGHLNDNRPIVFARFDDHSDGALIARQPIVVGALLEVNALWSELCTNREVLLAMSATDRLIEQRQFSAENLTQLYRPEFILYTAPALILAMTLQTTDVIETYRLASSVAHVVLNLRNEDFEKLAPPPGMNPWENLFAGFRASRDRGFAYTAICQSASCWVDGRPVEEWLDEALERVGLSSASSIYSAARERMREDVVVNGDDILGRAEKYLLSLGLQVFAMRSIGDTGLSLGRISSGQLPVPPMFDQEGRLIDLSRGAFDASWFPLEELHRRAGSLHTWTQNLRDACR
jgi:hypothetical protein